METTVLNSAYIIERTTQYICFIYHLQTYM